MKKILLIFVVMMIGITIVKAQGLYNRGVDSRISTYVLTKSSTATLASAVTIYNRIIGYTFADSAAGEVALFDTNVALGPTTATGPSTSNVFSEVMVAAGGQTTILFPLPRNTNLGLVVKMSTGTGAVTVYYE